MRKLLVLTAVVALITTACRAEANFVLDVTEDGSGTVTVEVGVDDELMELLEGFGGSDQLLGQLPQGADVAERREGEMTFYSATEPFEDSDDLLETAAVFEEADAAFQDFELVVEDGGATLDATIGTPDATETIEGLGGFGDLGDLGIDEIFTSSLIVALPGEVVSTNADEVLADGRLSWDIPVTGGLVDVMAETEAARGGFPWGLVIGIAIVLLITAGAALWVQNRRKASEEAISAAPVPSDPSPVLDPPSTTEGDAVIE